MIISAIVACAKNRIIGRDNDLPWRLPGDLRWFKQKTLNRHIIMGRRSFESIPKPLPNRVNIVVTRDKTYYHSGVIIVHSIDDAISYAHDEGEDEVFVLGGGKIYEQTMDIWDRLYLTEVHASPMGDTYFPKVDMDLFSISFEEHNGADARNQYDYTFKILERNR